MPQLRKELLGENWIVIAEERKDRPFDFEHSVIPNPSLESCPFEPGVEEQTPAETDRIPAPDNRQSDWLVRTVPNKFPAFRQDLDKTVRENGYYSSRGAYGHHEVIVENPRHDLRLEQFPPDAMDAVLEMYQRRIRDLNQRDSIEYVQVFRNAGKQAGASLSHPHSQLAAFPFVPSSVESKLNYAQHYYRENDVCPICHMLEGEIDRKQRLVRETDHFLVLCPYASYYPYETWILPKDHRSHFEQLEDSLRSELAESVPDVAARLSHTLTEPAFNVVLQNTPAVGAPPDDETDAGDYFHWILKFIPRIQRSGGFELATDIHINNIPPEYAADNLRD